MTQPDNEQHMSKHRTKVGKRPLSERNHPQQTTTKKMDQGKVDIDTI